MGFLSRGFEAAIVSEWQDGRLRRFGDSLAAEEPLEIRAGGIPISVTMRTPGHDDELAAGFLYTEGLIKSPDEIASIHRGAPADATTGCEATVIELSGAAALRKHLRPDLFASGGVSCGKASIYSVSACGIQTPNPDFRLDPQVLCSFPEKLKAAQSVFGSTGGLHAAALFDNSGTLVTIREDVRAQNAVDKIVGWALFSGQSLSKDVLVVSGHGESEIIHKALVAGLPVVATVSSPSSLAVHLSRDVGLTLVGFLRKKRFVVYAGEHRLGIEQPDRQMA